MVLPLMLLTGLAQAVDCPGLEAQLAAIDGSHHCLTMPLRDAWLQARDIDAELCLATALAERGLPISRWPDGPPVAPTAACMPDKLVEDTYDLPNNVQSDNFVAWWGDGANIDSHDVDDMLDYFEDGWEYHVDTMELTAPEGSDTHKFNVYLGDSGSGAPSVYGNSGYFWYDSHGQPMIVMNMGTLDDADWCKTTAVHELFHAVQAATGNYSGSSYKWIWEATASWVEGEVYPESPYYASFLFGFAFQPHLPLDFYDYPDTGSLDEYHQYGAFIFPRYISEISHDWTLVRDVWSRGAPSADPLDVFDTLLVEQGTTLFDTWSDFNAHNAVWDYQDGSTFEWYLDYYAGYYDDYWIADSLANAGTDQWQTPTVHQPQRFGVNNIELRYPNDGTLHVELELDAVGSHEHEAQWAISIVREGSQLEYLPLEVVDYRVSTTIEDVGDETAIHLVVGATSPYLRDGETFGYSYRLWVESPPDTASPEDTGDGGGEAPTSCGCAGTGAASVGWLALALLGVVVGARRRR